MGGPKKDSLAPRREPESSTNEAVEAAEALLLRVIKDTGPGHLSKLRTKIKEMTIREASEYASGGKEAFFRLLEKMIFDDFVFLLEKISKDALEKVFRYLKGNKKYISLFVEKVNNNPDFEYRLGKLSLKLGYASFYDLVRKLAKKDQKKITDQDINIEIAEPGSEKFIMGQLVTEIEKLGYSITPSTLNKTENIISDLEKLKKIIIEVRQKAKEESENKTMAVETTKSIISPSVVAGGYDLVPIRKDFKKINNEQVHRDEESAWESLTEVYHVNEEKNEEVTARDMLVSGVLTPQDIEIAEKFGQYLENQENVAKRITQ